MSYIAQWLERLTGDLKVVGSSPLFRVSIVFIFIYLKYSW